MATPDNTPQPFWKKLIGDGESTEKGGGNVLDNILSIAGKTAAPLVETLHVGSDGHGLGGTPPEANDDETKQATKRLRNAQSMLASIVGIAVIGSAGFYIGVFDEDNGALGSVGIYNLPATVAARETLAKTLETDLTDTRRFTAMMQLEEIATKVSNLDLDDTGLNYRPPEGGAVAAEDGSESYRTTDEKGNVIYIPTTEVNQKQSVRAARTDFARTALTQILLVANDLELTRLPAKIAAPAKQLTGYLKTIDLEETNFPSVTTRTDFRLAQGVARDLMSELKEKNLGNLVADLKKQAQTIDTYKSNVETQALVRDLITSLEKINVGKPSSFTDALNRATALRSSLSSIDNDTVYRKVIALIGDGDTHEGDLTAAANIAQNLARETAINRLDAQRVAWSSIIESTEKIARLGADQLADNGTHPTDARRDIDAGGAMFRFTGYSAKSDKREVEVRGRVVGNDAYAGRNFTAIADFADALEGSPVFKNVEATTYTKTKDLSGVISSPIAVKLTLQNAGETDTRDIKNEQPEVKKTVEKKAVEAKPTTTSAENPTSVTAVNAAPETPTTSTTTATPAAEATVKPAETQPSTPTDAAATTPTPAVAETTAVTSAYAALDAVFAK